MKKLVKILSLALVLCLCSMMFVACTPSSSDAMRDRYEDEGYTVVVISESNAAQYGIEFDKIEWAVVAMKGNLLDIFAADLEMAVAIRYKDAADAKEAEEEWDSASDKERDGAGFIKSGKIVVTGTEEAVKIAK